ncbi:MAG: phage portal protein [Bryobacterales bacterium]|nr:phage portal protein [Bryobacterales bacterium]
MHPLAKAGVAALGMIGLQPKRMYGVPLTASDYARAISESEHVGFGDLRTNPLVARERALAYPPLFRCVNLIASTLGWLIGEGHITIVDMNGEKVDNRRSKHILDLICGVPDGRTASETFWADVGIDYGVWGNSCLAITRNSSYEPIALHRINQQTIQVDQGSTMNRVYEGSLSEDWASVYRSWAEADIAHPRWPHTSPYNSGYRWGMAESPVRLLDRTIRTGIAAGIFTENYFSTEGSLKSKLAIGFKNATTAQVKEIDAQIDNYMTSQRPLTLGDDPTFHMIKESPSDADTLALREFQVNATGSIYGMPSVLLNQNLTSWGQGIAELGRLAWQFGLRGHVAAVLSGLRPRLLLRGQRFMVSGLPITSGNPKDLSGLIRILAGHAQPAPLATRDELRKLAGLSKTLDGKMASTAAPAPGPTPAPNSEPAIG